MREKKDTTSAGPVAARYRIRDYADADYPAVVGLWRTVLGGTKPEDEPGPLARTADRNPGLFLVADVAGEVVATALGTTDGRRGFIYHVAVLPSWRRRGVARALLTEVERRLWATGIKTIHLRVESRNVVAIDLYRRLGYTIDPQDIVGMRKTGP